MLRLSRLLPTSCFLLLLLLGTAFPARADEIVIRLDTAVQFAQPGMMLVFRGTLDNPTPGAAFIEGWGINSFNNTSGFPVTFTLAPLPSVLPGQSTTPNMILFTATISPDFSSPTPYVVFGTYSVAYHNANGTAPNATINYSIIIETPTTVPEPATILLLGSGLAGAGYNRFRRRRRRKS